METSCTNPKSSILICGAGHQGLAMAAHLALEGNSINLWNRSKDKIEKIIKTNTIYCEGVIKGTAHINRISTDIKELMSDFIMIAAPSTAHRDIARELAPHINDNSIIVLNPGRTFGAIEFAEELMLCGVKKLPVIAETQTILYTCRKINEDTANIIAFKTEVEIATLHRYEQDVLKSRMPGCISKYFKYVDSVMITSLSNIGMILHCAPMLMNIGWIESKKVDFKYYYDGISETIALFCEIIDKERLKVAKKCGYEVDSIVDWLRKTYRIDGDSLYDCLQNNEAYRHIDAPKSLNNRYIFEDIPNGLVPIEALGKDQNVDVRNISSLIDIGNSVTGCDFRKIGRTYSLNNLKSVME